MKKYRVKYKCDVTELGYYSSKEEAEDKLMEYLKNFEDDDDEGYFSSPSNYVIDEVELSPNDLIPDFESARKYLKLEGPNLNNCAALIALDQLFTIAEAWNKVDGFVPDFSNYAQKKWVPTFDYNDDYTGLDFWASTFFSTSSPYDVGFRLCFKTKERAEQFGKQFIELYNKAFLSNK